MSALKVRGKGQYGCFVGVPAGSVQSQIVCTIEAQRGVDEAITRIAVSYENDTYQDPNAQGRVIVLKEPLQHPDDPIDPTGLDVGANVNAPVALDQFIHQKHLTEVLRPGDFILVPAGRTFQVILTAAYSQGDALNNPSDKRAKLLVDTRTLDKAGKPVQLY